MATAAAAQLASAAGVGLLTVPLVTWAAVQALVIAALGLARCLAARRWPIWPVDFGAFTIPIGCSVVGIGLADLHTGAATSAAALAVTLGWVTTAWLGVRMVTRPVRTLCDGTWFLAPAAPLADAIGVVALAGRAPASIVRGLWVLAAIACAAGTIGYLVVLALAVIRVRRNGLRGAPPVCWWVATGCGGLAAAAIGRVGTGRGSMLPASTAGWCALVLWLVGCVIIVPILASGIRHLVRQRCRCRAVVWPPTFSMGVFALGAGQVGMLLGSGLVTGIFHLAAGATVAFWAVTTWLAVWVPARGRVLAGHGRTPA